MGDTVVAGEAKRAVLDFLKRKGPSEVADIAAELGVTAMAVRQHLYALEDEGFVAVGDAPKSAARGRPSKHWRAMQKADAVFADAHADVSVELVANIREVFGERGLDKLIAKRTEQQIGIYRAAIPPAATLKEKLKRLAKLRSDAGYMAEVVSDGDGFLFVENHCPICRVAAACTGLCRQELDVFRAALGRDVVIERTDHILAGARRCAYTVRAKRSFT